MKAVIVNAGNRDGDLLKVRHGNKSTLLRRGETLDLGGWSSGVTETISVEPTHDPGDEYVGTPQVVVLDPPRQKDPR